MCAKKNMIRRLKVEDSRYIANRKEMEKMVTTFFKNLYTRDDTISPEPLLDMIHNKVNDAIYSLIDIVTQQ